MGIESAVNSLNSSRSAQAVTKSDSTTYAGMRAVYVGTAGDLTVTIGGSDVAFKNVASGQLLPICPTKIKAATTAADIVALF